MDKISKIIPPSRRTQYVELAKKNAMAQSAADSEGSSEVFQKPASRVSMMNAKRIDTLLAKEKELSGKVKASSKDTDDSPIQDISSRDKTTKQIEFNTSADAAPDILENIVVDKNTTPIDRVNIARAKEASEFIQGKAREKKGTDIPEIQEKSASPKQSASPLSASESKKASYESMKEAKSLQAARDIAKKFQSTQDNVEAKKEIKGLKPKSEAVIDNMDRNNEPAVRS